MTNSEITMAEKREIIRGQTFQSHAISEANQEQGRFAKINRVEVTGVPRYPAQPPLSPWACDPLGPEMLIDATDCSDTYVGEPLGTPAEIEATSAPSTPYAQTGRRGSHTPASTPVEEFSASPGGAPTFKRRI
jgi:hypothetical protein